MGGACRTHEKDEVFLQSVWSENLKGRDHLEDPSVNARLLLKLMLEKSGGRV
jgi:hypothetical protein